MSPDVSPSDDLVVLALLGGADTYLPRGHQEVMRRVHTRLLKLASELEEARYIIHEARERDLENRTTLQRQLEKAITRAQKAEAALALSKTPSATQGDA